MQVAIIIVDIDIDIGYVGYPYLIGIGEIASFFIDFAHKYLLTNQVYFALVFMAN